MSLHLTMQKRVLTSCIGMLLCMLSLPVPAQMRGTLFTSPEQRAYLDYLRQDFLAKSRERGFDIEEAEIPDIPDDAAQEQAPEIYTLGGIMARHDGSHTIWLNGQALSENDLPAGVTLTKNSGVEALRFTTATGSHLLKPGQTLELTAGSVVEAYQRPQVIPLVEAELSAETQTQTETDATTAVETDATSNTAATEAQPTDTPTNAPTPESVTVTMDIPEDVSDIDTELGRQEIELQIETLQNLLEAGDEQ
jgi:hypothetical protein